MSHSRAPKPLADDADACWVSSELAPDGYAYVPTIGVGLDRVFTPPDPVGYALTVIRACAYAAYDAAVVRQVTDFMGLSVEYAAQDLVALRAGRPPLDDTATAPLRFTPIVAARTRGPAVIVHLDGQPYTQWSVAEATGHAVHVLEAAAVVDLDAAYLRFLIDRVKVTPDTARAAVADLAHHRHDHPPAQPEETGR